MTASAIALALAGVACTFAPDELLARAAVTGFPTVVIQLFGACLIGFGMINWTARQSLIGGIYNRPVAVGNVLHFTSSAVALLKAGAWVPAAIYGVFAAAFWWILFTSPVRGIAGTTSST